MGGFFFAGKCYLMSNDDMGEVGVCLNKSIHVRAEIRFMMMIQYQQVSV